VCECVVCRVFAVDAAARSNEVTREVGGEGGSMGHY
jgi:hypothetical protein